MPKKASVTGKKETVAPKKRSEIKSPARRAAARGKAQTRQPAEAKKLEESRSPEILQDGIPITKEWLVLNFHQLLAKAQHKEDLDAEISIMIELAKLVHGGPNRIAFDIPDINVNLTRRYPEFSDG